MDLQAFYFQAAEAAATVAVGQGDDEVAAPKLPSRAAVMLSFDVQQGVGLGAAGDAAAHGVKTTLSLGAAAAGAGVKDTDAGAREGGSLICPECGKVFLSDKAMYGHLRAHPGRGYKGASRPGTPAAASAAAAGDARPRKAPPRKEVPGLPAIKWPVTAKRSRTPTVATPPPVSADPAPVLLLEPPRVLEPVPLQMLPPPRAEPAVLLLEPPRSEEEEAAFTLLELYQRMRGGAPTTEPEDQLMQVDDAVAGHQNPPPVEHIFGIIVEPQAAPDVEQSNVTAASKGKMPLEPEPQPDNSGSLVLLRDRDDKIVSAGPSKRPKKRPLQGPDQTQPPAAADAAEEARLPPLRRIPSPASDRTYVCPMENCAKTFPTHQALGGHMANHYRNSRGAAAAAQNMQELAAARAVHNIMVHHQLRQDALLGEDVPPPLPKATKTHSCSRCDVIFPTGQALGGHMRKHWLEEKAKAPPAHALAVPVNAVVQANALALAAAAPAALANAPVVVVPIAAAAAPNGEPRDFEFDLNEMPME